MPLVSDKTGHATPATKFGSAVAAVALALIAGTLSMGPVAASAQTTGTEVSAATEVSIVFSPDEGQIEEVVVVRESASDSNNHPAGFLATTGDAAPWVAPTLAGVVAAGLMVWAIKHDDDDKGEETADGGGE